MHAPPRDDLDLKIAALHAEGKTDLQMEQELGVPRTTICARRNRMGLPAVRRWSSRTAATPAVQNSDDRLARLEQVVERLLSSREEAAPVVSGPTIIGPELAPKPDIRINWQPDKAPVLDSCPNTLPPVEKVRAITPQDVPAAPYVNRLQKAIIYGDVHFGHEAPPAVDLLLQVMREERPEQIIMNGDVVDAEVFSTHPKDPQSLVQFRHEQERLRDFLQRQAAAAPGARIVWRDGNHENRIKLRANETAFAGLPEVSSDAMLYKREFGIEHLPYDEPTSLWGWDTIIHGDRTRKEPGQLALFNIKEYGCCGLNNHDHKRAHVKRRLRSGIELEWIQNGCLCDLDPSYTKGAPDWQHGFTVFYMAKHYPRAKAQLIQIDNGEVIYGGRLLLAA